jgi:hypothetical protein
VGRRDSGPNRWTDAPPTANHPPLLRKEQLVHRTNRTRHPDAMPGWGPAPGWSQSFPGWSPLVDHGPLPLRAASSIARWWWPILALASFGTVTGLVLGHDHPAPGLSVRGLVTIALAALVVVLLTLHRAAGPGPLTRAVAEYAVVAVLAGLLAADLGSLHQQPSNPAGFPTKTEARQAARSKSNLEAGQNRPGVLQVAAAVARAVTKAIRAVTGAAGWLVDLWRRADQQADRRSGRSPSPTTPTGEAMPRSPAAASTSPRRLL